MKRLAWLLAPALLIAAALPPIAEAATANSLGLRATYDVDATFHWTDRSVSVRTSVDVGNTTGSAVSLLAFNLAPLRIGHARLGAVTVNGGAAGAYTDDQTVLVPVSPSLSPGSHAQVVINYSAALASSTRGDLSLFARAGGVMTAYRWIPWLSRTTRFDRPSVGEPWVTPNSPHVRVAITTDRALTFATSGRRISSNGLTQTFEATNVRDFNFSAAPDYRSRSRTVRGTKITFFYRSMPAGTVVDWAARAVNSYTTKVGSYPYPQLVIGETGRGGPAIESPSMFWLPSNTPSRLLAWTVTHEVAHQWFYSVVGNDQATEPFADEAISDFMSRDLIGRFVPSQCATGHLDQTIYQLGSCYPWVIYVQGNLYLRAYRDQVGATAFWRGVHNYYAAYKYRLGGTRQLLNALDASSGISFHHERFPTLYP